MLDVGSTRALLQSGELRPTVFAFSADSGVESVALDWSATEGPLRAFEEARRYLRDRSPDAYAVVAQLFREGNELGYGLPGTPPPPGAEQLGVALLANGGLSRSALYPIRRTAGRISFGQPALGAALNCDWLPIGDIWGNPFCERDLVRFRPGERAVDPGSGLWHAIVELTRMRIHQEQGATDDYMSFLDDLRNGIFVVAGRTKGAPREVVLRPRTVFNPLGMIRTDAARLILTDAPNADIEGVPAG